MSYENPITVVDTESAKIRAAGMASFGQSVGGAITALGQRQRQEAKERKAANLAEANSVVKYNDAYQSKIWSSTDAFKENIYSIVYARSFRMLIGCTLVTLTSALVR